MKLPTSLQDKLEWNIVGPICPSSPANTFPTLAVDGGARFVPNFDLWIGDNDSYLEKIDSENAFFFPSDKDHSDLSLALSLFINTNAYTLHLYGFLGGRRDHELFNLGEISSHLLTKTDNKVFIYEGEKLEFIFVGAGTHDFDHHGLISIGTLFPQKLSLQGQLSYTGESNFAALSSLGLSNKASGPFKISATQPFFIYLDHSNE